MRFATGFDFSAVSTPFRMQPGLRRVAPGAPQLTPTLPGHPALQAKLAVLRGSAGDALLAMPGFDATPAVRTLAKHAALEHPQALQRLGDDSIRLAAPLLGWSVDGERVCGDGPAEIGDVLRRLPAPWRTAGLLALAFAEDFAVIDGATGRIPWLAVCLPSHWAPVDKVGRHFAEVHAPVADNRLLLAAAESLARLVTGNDRWERFVWTITSHGGLDAHPARIVRPPWPLQAGPDALAAQAWFRTERQTFIPLPEAQQAIFTILVELQPLADVAADPGHARQLHDGLASMSDAVLAYRGLGDARDRLLTWLHARAEPAAT